MNAALADLRQRKSKSGGGGGAATARHSCDNLDALSKRRQLQHPSIRPPIRTFSPTMTALSSCLLMGTKMVCISCAAWVLLFLLFGGTSRGKDFYSSLWWWWSRRRRDKASVAVVALVLPTLLAATLASLAAIRRPEQGPQAAQAQQSFSTISASSTMLRRRNGRLFRWAPLLARLYSSRISGAGGDVDYRHWSRLVIVAPCLVFAFCSAYRKALDENTVTTAGLAEAGNALGIAALVALALLLVPVAHHGSLLQLFGGNAAAAVQLHIAAGRLVMLLVALHGGCHVVRWAFLLHENVVSLFVIPTQCWMRSTTQSSSSSHQQFKPVCVNKLTDCSCYAHARNVTGLVAALALLVIGMSTLHVVRRTWYAMFYKIHIAAGPTLLLCVVLHWNRSIVYLAGSLLYYLACSMLIWVEQWRQQRATSLRVISVERLAEAAADDRPCLAITFAASDTAMSRYRSGMYIKLKCPSISSIWHPFTVNMVPGEMRQLRLIVRCTGPFTSALAARIMATTDDGTETLIDPPPIHLDGFHGCPFRAEQVLQHDVVVFVAGGVGITPYVSLLHRVHALSLGRPAPVRRLVLHWTCRDPPLMDFVQREYFDPLISIMEQNEHTNQLRLHIIIHRTGRSRHASNGRVVSYTDLENPQDCEGTNTERGSPIAFAGQIQGLPFTPSRYSPGSKTSLKGNAASFLSFVVIAWMGLAGIWYLYRNHQSSNTVLPRLFAPIYMIVLSLVVSLAVHWLFAESIIGRYCGVNDDADGPILSSGWEEVETSEIAPTMEKSKSSLELGDINMVDLDLSHAASLDATSEVIEDHEDKKEARLEIRDGRPTVHQFMNSFDGSRSPGLFACGPTSLLNDIRRATNDRCLMRYRQCIQGKPRIALYEEAFEM
jgi:predicted ferric reductase